MGIEEQIVSLRDRAVDCINRGKIALESTLAIDADATYVLRQLSQAQMYLRAMNRLGQEVGENVDDEKKNPTS
jgi:hypothetical protein